ncbi:hypothetical protein BDV09DRAFT_200513 [Aspergillus tetrazonus]
MRRTLENSGDQFTSDDRPDTVLYNGWPRRLAAWNHLLCMSNPLETQTDHVLEISSLICAATTMITGPTPAMTTAGPDYAKCVVDAIAIAFSSSHFAAYILRTPQSTWS